MSPGEEALVRAARQMSETLTEVLLRAPGYDWNGDPQHLTLMTGGAFAVMRRALAAYAQPAAPEEKPSAPTVSVLRQALRGAVEWMSEDGCDCGTDEPGTCALCVAERALKLTAPEERLAPLDPSDTKIAALTGQAFVQSHVSGPARITNHEFKPGIGGLGGTCLHMIYEGLSTAKWHYCTEPLAAHAPAQADGEGR